MHSVKRVPARAYTECSTKAQLDGAGARHACRRVFAGMSCPHLKIEMHASCTYQQQGNSLQPIHMGYSVACGTVLFFQCCMGIPNIVDILSKPGSMVT